MIDLTPDIFEITDSKVVGMRMPAQGGLINIVKHVVTAFDGNKYICYSQSEYHNGQKFSTPYYGFQLFTDDSSTADTQPIQAVAI